jgi:hypothetical protein
MHATSTKHSHPDNENYPYGATIFLRDEGARYVAGRSQHSWANNAIAKVGIGISYCQHVICQMHSLTGPVALFQMFGFHANMQGYW